MCPVRHEDDVRRRPIASWDSWVDKAIGEAQEQGEFDNLPGHGKPLRIESNPFAPELDLAHSVLKNADMAPPWIELNRAIEAELAALARLRAEIDERLAIALARHHETAATGIADALSAAPAKPARWLRWWRGRRRFVAHPATATPAASPSLTVLAAERARARAHYLERAATLDKKIREYHDTLPATLWHLQRPRLTPERAAREFDAAVPTVGGEGGVASLRG